MRRDHDEVRSGDGFEDGRFARAGKIDENMIGRVCESGFANYSRETIALDGFDGKALDVGLPPPALDGAVLIEIEDKHLLASLREPRSYGGADRRLADTAFRGRKGNNHEALGDVQRKGQLDKYILAHLVKPAEYESDFRPLSHV